MASAYCEIHATRKTGGVCPDCRRDWEQDNSADNATMQLALGRILRLASRPEQSGDIAEYERCRKLFLDAAERKGFSVAIVGIGNHRPGFNFGRMVD